eukprot:CAMPEP_0119283332 /NCGR_PEP_ID=MMETSP1329-20130426/28316_1 /TAXON_ID=114041 /ORGANISM="Genus nov. species nov., Strain RCC1024" /LENGTH=199 /DNA_ID=CAMNT_0007284003 /DNA_START=69 /DNA_END=665 /DNA_ORIENTATION=+
MAYATRLANIAVGRLTPKPYARSSTALSAAAVEEEYAKSLKIVHWIMAGGTIGCIASVQAAMSTTKDSKPFFGQSKGELMGLHKSFGLTVAVLALPRVALRLTTKIPAHLPGLTFPEQLAGSASHLALYGGMVAMSATGVTMGLLGKGIPFFGYKVPALETQLLPDTKNGAVAGQAFKLHKAVGPYFKYLVPVHAGAAF